MPANLLRCREEDVLTTAVLARRKLITYASVLDATAVIWIAEEFTDEYKKALDWLNDHSSEDLAYYGVSLEVWKIDDSPGGYAVGDGGRIVRQVAAE